MLGREQRGFGLFDPAHLEPLIADLRARLPSLRHVDGPLEHLLDQVISVDGSFFNLAFGLGAYVGALAQVAETGATFVHPFEDPLVMRGQGTAALELHEQVGHLDVLIVPMSGGGLMAGCASAIRQLDPNCEIIGVEPANADDTRQSFAAGHPVRIAQPDTIADGLAVTSPGVETFAINRELVTDVVTVTEEQLVDALRVALDAFEQRYEPSGVAGLAAVLADRDRFRGRRIGIILSGGNIDQARFDALTQLR